MSATTTIAGKTILITGANRGLGKALVDEALRRGARRVYAASRQPLVHADPRVTPVILDVTEHSQIERAAASVDSLDVLINNVGVSVPDDLSDRSTFEQHLAVNLYGTLDVTRAFLPSLAESRGALVNVVSLGALAALPGPASLFGLQGSLALADPIAASAARGRGPRGPPAHPACDRRDPCCEPAAPRAGPELGGKDELRELR
jgi:NAD(P)-dependent dehydrogenase (short-subunit alcohol dehydrogenase family)